MNNGENAATTAAAIVNIIDTMIGTIIDIPNTGGIPKNNVEYIHAPTKIRSACDITYIALDLDIYSRIGP